jgi:hypothetical protein
MRFFFIFFPILLFLNFDRFFLFVACLPRGRTMWVHPRLNVGTCLGGSHFDLAL